MAKQPLKLLLAEHQSRTYCLYVDPLTSQDEILAPGYWANVAKTLAIGDEIKVIAEDMTWRMVLLVRAVSRLEAVVYVLAHDTMGQAADATGADVPYATKWRGPARKWSVILKKDGSVVKEDFQIEEEAKKWIGSHMKAMAA